mgnify:CR=1 FL=1
MKAVFVYGFEATYLGNEVYEYNPPVLGDRHKCMLFLSQDSTELEFKNASSEIEKFGFRNVENLRGNRLKVEVLNTDNYKGFTCFYDEALETGQSLVFYPNT